MTRRETLAGPLRVLVVDDEDDLRLGLSRLVGKLGAEVRAARDGAEAWRLAQEESFDVVLTDLRMPELGGAELLARLRRLRPAPEVVVVTGYGTIQSAVSSLQSGAAHFLTKPFDNDEVLRVVERLGRQARALRSAWDAPSRDAALGAGDPIAADASSSEGAAGSLHYAADPPMRELLTAVQAAAASAEPALILGENGVRHEDVARRLHACGAPPGAPFAAVRVAALTDPLLEQALFGGGEAAAAVGVATASGLLFRAEGGVVFLDEISAASPGFQDRLRRALGERRARPRGAEEARPIRARVIASTSRDLAGMIRRGLFREDLATSLGGIALRIPPLRERPGDLLPLAERYRAAAARACLPLEQAPPTFGPAAVAALAAHRWPGNLVELENAVRRAVVAAEGAVIAPHHLGLDFAAPAPEDAASLDDYNAAKQRAVEAFQNEFVRRALEKSGGNVSQAAERCGLARTALQRIMRRIGLGRGDAQ